MIISEWGESLKHCPKVQKKSGFRLYHGARRTEGQPIILDQMFLSNDADIALQYCFLDPGKQLNRDFLTFEIKKDLTLVDISGVLTHKLAYDAQQKYGEEVVGNGDMPVRMHMLETVRKIFGNDTHGTISSGGIEWHFDSNLKDFADLVSTVPIAALSPPLSKENKDALLLLHEIFEEIRKKTGHQLTSEDRISINNLVSAACNVPLDIAEVKQHQPFLSSTLENLRFLLKESQQPKAEKILAPPTRESFPIKPLIKGAVIFALGFLIGKLFG